MSRIGKMPIPILEKVDVSINDSNIKVKGPLGELSFDFCSDAVKVTNEDSKIIVSPIGDKSAALWGTTRSVINNMMTGVTTGYKKSLEIVGVGYKFEAMGQKLVLSIGYSHKVDMVVPEGLKVALDEKEKNILHISGIDKQLVGEYASKVRAKKKPEPYKGKGIKYVGEHIIKKAGKTGSK